MPNIITLDEKVNNVLPRQAYLEIKAYAGRNMIRPEQIDKGFLLHQFV